MSGFTMVVLAHVTGDIGGSGLSRFHVERTDTAGPSAADATLAGNSLHSFFAAFSGQTPSDIVWTIDPAVDVIDTTSAEIAYSIEMSPAPTTVSGLAAGAYAAGMGVRVNWKTNTVLNRRRIRGATMVVPLASTAYQSNGALQGSVVSTALSAGSALLASLATGNLALAIYHRPLKGATSGGTSGHVQAVQVTDVPAGLRSRRS